MAHLIPIPCLDDLTADCDIGLCASLLLLTESALTNGPDDRALSLALAIDKKNRANLHPSMQNMIDDLSFNLSRSVVTQTDWQINNLQEAIALISRHPELGVAEHVPIILMSIDEASRWNNAQLLAIEGQVADIALPGVATSMRSFHAHFYPGVEAKRSVLKRLEQNMMGAWNQAIQHEQGLNNFLARIHNSLCIEGATSDALAQVGSQTFLQAMHRYHDEAVAFLLALGFTPTIHNLKHAILRAYANETCLEHGNNPTVIDDERVDNYLQSLLIYSYFGHEDTPLDASWGVSLITHPIMTRYFLLNAIKPYCNTWHVIELSGLQSTYQKLAKLNTPGAKIDEFEYLSIIHTTLAFDARLFALIIMNGYLQLAQQLWQTTPKHARESIVLNLTEHVINQQLLTHLVNPMHTDFAMQFMQYMPEKAWAEVASEGNTAGQCALYGLACTIAGRALLARWLEKDPHSFMRIPPHAWRQPCTDRIIEGESALYWLARAHDGQPILKQWFANDPTLFRKITPKGWAQACIQGDGSGENALYWLAYTPLGRALLTAWIDDDRDAILQTPLEAWCCFRNKTDSASIHLAYPYALCFLASNEPGLSILQQYLTNDPTSLSKIDASIWDSHLQKVQHANKNILSWLADSMNGQALLNTWSVIDPSSFDRISMETWTRHYQKGIEGNQHALHVISCNSNCHAIVLNLLKQQTLTAIFRCKHKFDAERKACVLYRFLIPDGSFNAADREAFQALDLQISIFELSRAVSHLARARGFIGESFKPLLHLINNTLANASTKDTHCVKKARTLH